MKLTIKKKDFLDWYFDYGQDTENENLRLSLSEEIIAQMYEKGKGCCSVEELFDECNQYAIRAYFTQEFYMQTDEYDVELSDLEEFTYVTLI